METLARRARLGRHLLGSGFELGPGHMPYPISHAGIEVKYIDRWAPDTNSELFPELGGDAVFPEPDIIADLDTDRLQALSDESTDFVIASHLLEHLADPIGMLGEIHRVLHPGGVVLILLPDRHRTFDRLRSPTSVEHLAAEHRAGITQVDDAHIEEFIRATAPTDLPQTQFLSDDPAERQRQIGVHRRRSVHAHCWDQDEFVPVLRHCIDRVGQRWEFVDALLTEEGGPDSIEFGFILRKSISEAPTPVLGDRFETAWATWSHDHRELLRRDEEHERLMGDRERTTRELLELRSQVAGLEGELASARAELASARTELTSLRNTKTFRYTQLGRRVYARLTH